MMALYTIFTCSACGHRGSGLSTPPIWTMGDPCPHCGGTMNGDSPGVYGTYS